MRSDVHPFNFQCILFPRQECLNCSTENQFELLKCAISYVNVNATSIGNFDFDSLLEINYINIKVISFIL